MYVFASVCAIVCVEYVYTCVVCACICLCCVRTYIHVMNALSLCKLDGKWDWLPEKLGMRPGPDPKGLFRVRLRIRTPQKILELTGSGSGYGFGAMALYI